MKQLTGLIKKVGKHYVALCLEFNVASQGESMEEARKMLQEACEEYLSYIKEKHLEKEVKPTPLETLREFLVEKTESIRPSSEWSYSENISFQIPAYV